MKEHLHKVHHIYQNMRHVNVDGYCGDIHTKSGSIEQGRMIVLDIGLKGKMIDQIVFLAYGCGTTLAVAELLCRRLKDQNIDKLKLDLKDMANELVMPDQKMAIFNLVEQHLQHIKEA